MQTEKQKMYAGQAYNGADPELVAMWKEAQRLSGLLNNVAPDDFLGKLRITKQLLGSCTDKVAITAPFYCDYGKNIHLGENCEINFNCTFLDCNTITIGKNALIAPNVQLYTVGHPVNPKERIPIHNKNGLDFLPNIAHPIKIGDNVWLGGGSIVLPGVTIGDNVTIGAGSVVNKDIPSNCLAVGNPCRVVKSFN